MNHKKKRRKVHHARSQADDEEGDGDRESDSDDDSYSPSNKNETKKGHRKHCDEEIEGQERS